MERYNANYPLTMDGLDDWEPRPVSNRFEDLNPKSSKIVPLGEPKSSILFFETLVGIQNITLEPDSSLIKGVVSNPRCAFVNFFVASF